MDMLVATAFDRDDEFYATAGVSRHIKVSLVLAMSISYFVFCSFATLRCSRDPQQYSMLLCIVQYIVEIRVEEYTYWRSTCSTLRSAYSTSSSTSFGDILRLSYVYGLPPPSNGKSHISSREALRLMITSSA